MQAVPGGVSAWASEAEVESPLAVVAVLPSATVVAELLSGTGSESPMRSAMAPVLERLPWAAPRL